MDVSFAGSLSRNQGFVIAVMLPHDAGLKPPGKRMGDGGTGSVPVDLWNDDEFSSVRLLFRIDPQRRAPVLISLGGQSAHGQPPTTTQNWPYQRDNE